MRVKLLKDETISLRNTEVSILEHLLEEHIFSGSYFGKKEQHYKMCKELLEKLRY